MWILWGSRALERWNWNTGVLRWKGLARNAGDIITQGHVSSRRPRLLPYPPRRMRKVRTECREGKRERPHCICLLHVIAWSAMQTGDALIERACRKLGGWRQPATCGRPIACRVVKWSFLFFLFQRIRSAVFTACYSRKRATALRRCALGLWKQKRSLLQSRNQVVLFAVLTLKGCKLSGLSDSRNL